MAFPRAVNFRRPALSDKPDTRIQLGLSSSREGQTSCKYVQSGGNSDITNVPAVSETSRGNIKTMHTVHWKPDTANEELYTTLQTQHVRLASWACLGKSRPIISSYLFTVFFQWMSVDSGTTGCNIGPIIKKYYTQSLSLKPGEVGVVGLDPTNCHPVNMQLRQGTGMAPKGYGGAHG